MILTSAARLIFGGCTYLRSRLHQNRIGGAGSGTLRVSLYMRRTLWFLWGAGGVLCPSASKILVFIPSKGRIMPMGMCFSCVHFFPDTSIQPHSRAGAFPVRFFVLLPG